MRRRVTAVLVGIATFLVAFIITNIAYIKWAVWRYPKANSMAGLSAFVLGLEIAPVCALVAFLLYLRFTRSQNSN